MATIVATLEDGARVRARVGRHELLTDQPLDNGGADAGPDPFSLFLASMATCAGFFAQRYCQARSLPTEGIRVELDPEWRKDAHLLESIRMRLVVPEAFPREHLGGLLKTAERCLVKRTLENPPGLSMAVLTEGEAVAA